MSEAAQYHVQRLAALRSQRGNWDSQWEEAASYLIPAHRDSFQARGASTVAGTEGAKKTELMFDATAAFAAHRFASIIESLLVPQGSLWHNVKVADPALGKNRIVRRFYDDVNQALMSQRYRPIGNFVGNSQQVFHSLGVYGNGVLFIDQPEGLRGLRYRNVHLGEVYFVENHANIVDTMYRARQWTIRQIMQVFGDAAPEEVKALAKQPQQLDQKKEILHCVYPRTDRDPRRVDAKGMPFASVYIYCETQKVMREGGYRSFPYAVARHSQHSGEVYGRGPAQMVLPAIKVLNEEKKTVLKQGHRVVDPVLLAHDDGNLSSFSLKAGALNAGGVSKEGRLLVQPLPVGNIAVGDKLMEMEKAVINDAFLIPLFQILVDTPQMTATEVLERAREKGMLLAPTAGRLQAEFLGPLLDREIDVLQAQGLLPPAPPLLAEAIAEYKIEYDSPMTRMAKAERAAGFMRALGQSAEYAKMTGDIEPLDWFNFDVAVPAIQEIQGAPVEWTRTLDEVAERRKARAQQAQAQQMIEAAPAVAGVVKAVGAGA